MANDSLSQALAQRRGRTLHSSLMNQMADDGSHDAIDHDLGIGKDATEGGERQGTPSVTGTPQFNRESPTHLDEHTLGANESQAPAPVHPDMDKEIIGHIADHASADDYDNLKGMKPRSLGERAKMAALEKQYGKK